MILKMNNNVRVLTNKAKISAEVVLLTGYKHIGKDTLYKQLTTLPGETVRSWSVYCHAEAIKRFPNLSNVKRLSFIDDPKKEVTKYCSINVADDMKDDYLDSHYESYDSYIERAKILRASYPEYSTKLVVEQIKPGGKYVITDWRFPNEYQYLSDRVDKVVTARVFHSSVTIPPAAEESQHALDKWATQYLITPESLCYEEFHKAVKVFPFYEHYVQCDLI